MSGNGTKRVYVRSSNRTSQRENNTTSITAGGFSDNSSMMEWFRERLNRIATKDMITKVELEYAVRYYEVRQ